MELWLCAGSQVQSSTETGRVGNQSPGGLCWGSLGFEVIEAVAAAPMATCTEAKIPSTKWL